MARRKQPPVPTEEARAIGALLRGLRRAAGLRAVHDAASLPECPAAAQTIYAYERGGLVPSLAQFLELVEFYTLRAPRGPDAKPEEDLRALGVAAVVHALGTPAYHVPQAVRLMERLRPRPAPRRRGRGA